jgi:prephenate dehydrogenase
MTQHDHPSHPDSTLPTRVGVVGLGLIGGSLAKALHSRTLVEVVGIDPDPAVITQALAEGVLTVGGVMPLQGCHDNASGTPLQAAMSLVQTSRPVTGKPAPAAETGPIDDALAGDAPCWSLLAGCDFVFVCTPPETVPGLVRAIRPWTAAILTDVASVKRPVLDQIGDGQFIGGHPMAGSEKHGYEHASEILFENAVYVLCLPAHSTVHAVDFRRLETLISSLGAAPLSLDADAHDRAVAAVSHLPHVAAAALSLLAARQADSTITRLAAGGFRDITRIASSDAGLWSAISLESRTKLLPQIEELIQILQEFHEDLQQQDLTKMRQFFFQAAQFRGSLPIDGRGALLTPSILNVYIPDAPGVIGKVTTLLGDASINIVNLRIREFRTYEGGSLQLLMPDSAQAAQAAWLLKEAGYECD